MSSSNGFIEEPPNDDDLIAFVSSLCLKEISEDETSDHHSLQQLPVSQEADGALPVAAFSEDEDVLVLSDTEEELHNDFCSLPPEPRAPDLPCFSAPLTQQDYLLLTHFYQKEEATHAFTHFYNVFSQNDMNYDRSTARIHLDTYTHMEAVEFMARSHVWRLREPPKEPLPPCPGTEEAVVQFARVYDSYALYRVILETDEKYVLVACHQNVHGLHRGDLRFIEVNSRTNAGTAYSCLGHLAIGDVLAVTELAKTECLTGDTCLDYVDAKTATPDGPLLWMARSVCLLERNTFGKVPFTILSNGCAVVTGYGEVMMVKKKEDVLLKAGKIYVGSGFIPEKMKSEFALGFVSWNEMALLSLGMKKFPNSMGSVLHYKRSREKTFHFETGTNAFNVTGRDGADVLETCVMIGSTAVRAVQSGRFDSHAYLAESPVINGSIIRFMIFIDDDEMIRRWRPATRIQIGGQTEAFAVIETVIVNGYQLEIVARLSRQSYHFRITEAKHMVAQVEPPESRGLPSGFFKQLPRDCFGRRILETLYGAPSMDSPPPPSASYTFPTIRAEVPFNEYQCAYISRILVRTPMTLASSPFGCGKSVTIVGAAYHSVMSDFTEKRFAQHLLITQSNCAAVNLCDIVAGMNQPVCTFNAVRLVSERNWNELPCASRSLLDLPQLMIDLFTSCVAKQFPSPPPEAVRRKMAQYLANRRLLDRQSLSKADRKMVKFGGGHFIPFSQMVTHFFELQTPRIIISTADSLPLRMDELKNVRSVQIDEASQLPECTLVNLLRSFPKACFGLVGDTHQLPPYCDDLIEGPLKEFGVGNTMERALQGNLFPKVVLRYVYRCHPKLTAILGDMFYGGDLIPAISDEYRNHYMKSRPDFWPDSNFPILVINNESPSHRMGTSHGNNREVALVARIVSHLTNHQHPIPHCAIGIISFYRGQTAVLTEKFRCLQIKVGTVDSFQGSEREVMILCLTNASATDFLANKNRVNVAMSRARQSTIIVGNVKMLQSTQYWMEFVRVAEEHRCVIADLN